MTENISIAIDSDELDPFWSDENISQLKKIREDVEYGRNMHEHELIEVDE